MTHSYDFWPFVKPEDRLAAEDARWWQECYLPRPVEEVIRGQTLWSVISGTAGSGKTTVLQSVLRTAGPHIFVLDYSPRQWKDLPQTTQNGHLWNWIHLVSRQLSEEILEKPELILQIPNTQRQFLLWAIRKFDSPRYFSRWLEKLPPESADLMQGIKYEDLYQSQTNPRDAKDQISELLDICQSIGYTRIWITMEVPLGLPEEQIRQLQTLFSWHELMHHPNLRLIAVMPRQMLEQVDPERLSKSRVRITLVDPPCEEVLNGMVQRSLQSASGGKLRALSEIAATDLLDALQGLIDLEIGESTPGAWLCAAQILLKQYAPSGRKLDGADLPLMRREFYRNYIPIWIAPNNMGGVWRGENFIPLDRYLFEFFAELYEGKKDRAAPKKVQDYHYTLAHRIRERIEPDPENPIYLVGQRNQGYWVENKRVALC